MNPKKDLSKEQQKLLENAEIKVQDKDYTEDEIKLLENDIVDYIMNKSFKHSNISQTINLYSDLANTIHNLPISINK